MRLSEIDTSKLDGALIKKIFFSSVKEKYDHADYIIVYGCHVKQLLDERLLYALSIIKNHSYDKIVLTGGIGINGDFNESEYMYNYLIKNGVSEDKIIIENKSTTTEENDLNILSMLDLNSIKTKTNIVLVTQAIHMVRIMLHWKKLINNSNIKFYYDYVEDSMISYDNIINDPNLFASVKWQLEKTINFIKEGKYVDIDID